MDTAGLTFSTDDHNSKDVNKSVFKDTMPNNAETVVKIEAKREFRFLSTLPCWRSFVFALITFTAIYSI